MISFNNIIKINSITNMIISIIINICELILYNILHFNHFIKHL